MRPSEHLLSCLRSSSFTTDSFFLRAELGETEANRPFTPRCTIGRLHKQYAISRPEPSRVESQIRRYEPAHHPANTIAIRWLLSLAFPLCCLYMPGKMKSRQCSIQPSGRGSTTNKGMLSVQCYNYHLLIFSSYCVPQLYCLYTFWQGVWGLGFGVWGLGFGVWEIGRASCRERV